MVTRGVLSVLERSRHALDELKQEDVSLEMYKVLLAMQEALEVVAFSSDGTASTFSLADLVKVKDHADHSKNDTGDSSEGGLLSKDNGLDPKSDGDSKRRRPGQYLYL